MYLTGFADEAAADLDGQIRATKELGWAHIESRSIDGTNLHDLPEEAFEAAAEKLDAAGVRVNCFGSTIANWGKQITDPFDVTAAEIDRAIPRMKRLGTKLIRIMSYAVLRDRDADDQMEHERFRRLREIVQRFGDAGLKCVHENCSNYGGMGWRHTQKMLERVPGLLLVFDTGNPVGTRDFASKDPGRTQSSWEFYRHVKERVAYVHVKDCTFDAFEDGTFNKCRYTWPGEGDGDIPRIVKDLVDSGYDGGFSMEPHLGVVFHEAGSETEGEARYRMYVEYGRRFMKILGDCGVDTKALAAS
ncbi:MAG TPA: sugar phosphate isomerase/epimerase [Phycisphaerae bacterium]|nr:sugar phosphate isomerase/epimerase [Phycisphaerae bacterium]